jgi:hypothetical protein
MTNIIICGLLKKFKSRYKSELSNQEICENKINNINNHINSNTINPTII